ncbi:hypothetical protein HLB15_06845, partial [Promicromonospora citrea]|nr:hypothetical protein [Promicromonospora citrea]
MNEHERSGDPAFDRLVAADPARSAPEPAAGVLRARVDALLAASGETPATSPGAPGRPTAPGTGAEEERAGVDELAVRAQHAGHGRVGEELRPGRGVVLDALDRQLGLA